MKHLKVTRVLEGTAPTAPSHAAGPRNLAAWAVAAACALGLCASPAQLRAAPFPGTLSWQVKASIPGGVEGAAGGVIGNTLYVSHGYRPGDSSVLSIYDIPTDTWSAGPSATVARSEMAGGVAAGKYYAIGGRTGPNADVEAFDPGSGLWSTVASLSAPRGGLGAASIGGLIYAVGGRDGSTFGSGTVVGTNEVYDPGTDTWTTLAPMPTPLSDVYATVGFKGKVYVFGGASDPSTVSTLVQIYDPGSDTWSTGAPMPTARGAAMAGVLCDHILVFGGFDPNVGNLSVTEDYDPATNTWNAGPAMPVAASEISMGPTQTANTIFSVGNGIFGATGSDVQALVATGCPEHFMFYKVKTTPKTQRFTKFGPLVLHDQFGEAAYNVIKPIQLGLPAEKNREVVTDAVTHLKEYKVKPRVRSQVFPNVRIVNQCNDIALQVKKPLSLLVPTNKSLVANVVPPSNPGSDHFLCYLVKALTKLPKGMQVDVLDQFQFRRYDLKKITKLCNPVEKSGEPVFLSNANKMKGELKPITPTSIQHPLVHLVCYKATLARKYIPQHGCGAANPADRGSRIEPKQSKHVRRIGMFVNNQFGPERLDSIKENELCIPSLKNPRCGDNLVDQPNEQCDGTDDNACPGACRADCTCPPVNECAKEAPCAAAATCTDGCAGACFFTAEGTTKCFFGEYSCVNFPQACSSGSECPAGWACADSCCGQTCVPLCGTSFSPTQAPAGESGQSSR